MSVHPRARIIRRTSSSAALLAAVALVGSACSLVGSENNPGQAGDAPTEVVLVTHESFSLPDEVKEKFEKESGYELVIRAAGDAGEVSSKLSLTADNPIGDAAFGIDNTFASRVLEAGALVPHGATLPEGAEAFALAEGADLLAPIDVGGVCINVDTAWFEEREMKMPATLGDLRNPQYAELTVLPAASTSSPGMAFLLTTIAAYGSDWDGYWEDLLAGGVKIVDGWSDAYYTDFTAGSENGDRPIVLSYDSSPAFLLDDDGQPLTQALLNTCFEQVEYAGVLKGAENPEGAAELVQFLLSDDVQASLPEQMYVFPTSSTVELPQEWAAFNPRAEDPFGLLPGEIAENRETWLKEWTEIITR